MALTAEQRARYAEDGFLILEGFVPPAECDALAARAEALVAGFEHEPVAVFSAREQTRKSDEYFLGSAGAVRCFFEKAAVGPDGALRVPLAQAIDTIGFALHDLDPVFAAFSRRPAFAELAADLGLADPVLLQSMYIFKQPHIGGEIASHQDAAYLYSRPVTVVGLWLAVQDATRTNGCMWAAPGGHRTPLRKRFVRTPEGMGFVTLDPAELPAMDAPGAMVPLEAPAGTLVVLHGLLPHQSGPNHSARSRHAYALHLIDRAAEYPPDNWLQRPPDLPLRGFS